MFNLDWAFLVYAVYVPLLLGLYVLELLVIFQHRKKLFNSSFFRTFSVLAVVVSFSSQKHNFDRACLRCINIVEHHCLSAWIFRFSPAALPNRQRLLQCNAEQQRLADRSLLVSYLSINEH